MRSSGSGIQITMMHAHGSKRLGRVHGTLLIYSGDSKSYYKHLYRPDDVDYSEKLYMKEEPETGRRYRYGDLGAQGDSCSI